MVFDLESNPPLPNHPFIRLVEVTKFFRDETAKGGLRVLDRVSFEVERGETVVILGRSGVGKSVTLKHVLGFLRPDSGSVWVDGLEVSGMSEAELFAQHGITDITLSSPVVSPSKLQRLCTLNRTVKLNLPVDSSRGVDILSEAAVANSVIFDVLVDIQISISI